MTALIIAAHPDDEVLGAGGYMAKYPGCQVAILSEGTSAEIPERTLSGGRNLAFEEALEAKREATLAAASRLGAEVVYQGNYLDQQLAITNQALHGTVRGLLVRYEPRVVLTHHAMELNADHRVVAEVVAVGCRAFTSSGRRVERLMSFSVDAWNLPGAATPSKYQIMCSLTHDQLQAKLDALECYKAQLRPWPHPRNLEAIQAYHRWLGAVAGCEYAEPYALIWGRV